MQHRRCAIERFEVFAGRDQRIGAAIVATLRHEDLEQPIVLIERQPRIAEQRLLGVDVEVSELPAQRRPLVVGQPSPLRVDHHRGRSSGRRDPCRRQTGSGTERKRRG